MGLSLRWLVFVLLDLFLCTHIYAQLTITTPVSRMVFQRDLANKASVVVAGMAPDTATSVEARFVPLIAGQGAITPWTSLSFLAGHSAFRGQVTVSAGWYRMDVRAKKGTTVLTQTQVGRVGVGEVFVVAGQSNASGGFQRVVGSLEERVSCLDFRQDSISDQLLPLQFSSPTYGSAIGPSQPPHLWSTLGDKLVQRLNVPVLFFGTALGGSGSTEWQQGAIGNLGTTTNSSVYRRLGEALLHYITRTGARAVLWHQGETDTYYGVTNQTYYSNVNTIIQKSRQQVGSQPLAWMVARVSYNNYQTSPGIITAQNQLIADLVNLFPGPATDSIVGPENRPDNIHMKGPGLVKFTNSWDQALTNAFFQNATPFIPSDSGALITSGYSLPLARKPGDTIAVASLRSNPFNAGNQYIAQIIRTSDGAVVYESSPTLDNPILVKLPTDFPNGQYQFRTSSTNPVIHGTLSEPFTVQQTALHGSLLTVNHQPVVSGTAPAALRRFTYRYEPGSHGFYALIESTAPVEVRLERLDGSFGDSGWHVAPPSSQAPDYDDFANFNYIRNYPPVSVGVGGVIPGRYRYSVRLQGDTGPGLWYDVNFIDVRTILYAYEPIPFIQPILTTNDIPPSPVCLNDPITLSVQVIDGPQDGIYSIRLSDSNGSFANETTLASGTATSPITVTLSSELPSGTQYRIRAVSSDPNVASAPSAPFSLCNDADLSMNMSLSSRTPTIGQAITLTLVVTNNGPAPVDSVTVQSLLPSEMEFVDTISPAVSTTANAVTIKSGRLETGSSTPFAFRVKAKRAGTFLASAQIMTSTIRDPDSQPGSGTGDGQDDEATVDLRTAEFSDTVRVSPNPNQVPLPSVLSNQPPVDPAKADLSLAIKSDQLAIAASGVAQFTLIVSNQGGAAANNVKLQTLLPTGWQVTDVTSLTISGQTVTANIGSIAAGSTGTLTLLIRIPSSGILKSQVFSVTPSDPDSTPGNGYTNGEDDEASVSVRIR